MFVFNVLPTGYIEMGSQLNVSSDRLVKPRIEPETPGLQGKLFIHYTRLPLLFTRIKLIVLDQLDLDLRCLNRYYQLNGSA